MNRFVVVAFAVLLAGWGWPAAAGIGDADPAFGDSGRVAGIALPLADGRLLRWSGTGDSGYSRRDSHGQPDAAFGMGGVLSWPAGFRPVPEAWLRLPDGSTLLGGTFDDTAAALIHLRPSGEVDNSFAGTGILVWPGTLGYGRVDALLLRADGRVLVLRGEYYFDTPVRVIVHRLDSNLQLDRDFGTRGEAVMMDYRFGDGSFHVDAYQREFAELADGRIAYIDEYSRRGDTAPYLNQLWVRVRYLDAEVGRATAPPQANALLDPAINDWRTVMHLPDGGQLVQGFALGANPYYRLYRLRADGTPDTAFGTAGSFILTTTEPAASVTSTSEDGKYLYLCFGEQDDSISIRRILLSGTDAGRLDVAFGRGGVVELKATLGVIGMQPTPDGALLVATRHGTFRLQALPLPSPGILSLWSEFHATSRPGQLQARVTRSAGSDGAVGIHFRTADPMFRSTSNGVPGVDYSPVEGQLEWSDGVSADKYVTIPVMPGSVQIYFGLQLTDPQAAAVAIDRITLLYAGSPGGAGGSAGAGGGSAGSAGSAGTTAATEASGGSSPPASSSGNGADAGTPPRTTAGGAGALQLEWLVALALLALGRVVARRSRNAEGRAEADRCFSRCPSSAPSTPCPCTACSPCP